MVYPDESGYELALEASEHSASPAAKPTGTKNYATFGARVAAALIDAAAETVAQGVLSAVAVSALQAVLVWRGISRDQFALEQIEEVTVWAFAVAVGIAHQVFFQYWAGGTVGKLALGLKLVDELAGNFDTQTATFRQTCIRYLARWLSVCSLGFGFICPLWTAKRQTLHDLIARTVVVKRELEVRNGAS